MLMAQSDSVGMVVATPVRYDSAEVARRQFDAASMDGYRSDPDFHYSEAELEPSAWDRFKQWLRAIWRSMLQSSDSRPLFNYALVALGVTALLYIIIKLAGMDKGNVFSRSASPVLPHTEIDENIHTLDFDAELQHSIEQGQYRSAIRLLYLKYLKALSDHKLIAWKPAKTNADYQRELLGGPHSQHFKTLTYQFEYVWYGDFSVDAEHFETVRTAFEQVEREVCA